MLLVLSYHSWEFSGAPKLVVWCGGFEIDVLGFLRGNSRVDLFIVLSGFCLFLPLAKSPSSLQSWSLSAYAKRRAHRILPAYYAALFYPFLLWNWAYPIKRILGLPHSWQEVPTPGDLLTHALFVHTFFTQYWASLNGSLWTMGLEAQFYLTFPLLIWGIRCYGLRVLGGVIALSIAYRWFIHHRYGSASLEFVVSTEFLASITFIGRWMQFAFGMLCVWIVMRRLESGRALSPLTGSVLILGAAALHWLALQEPLLKVPAGRDITLGIAFATAIGAICLSRTPFNFLVDNWAMRKLGFISYSLFLLHQPTLYWLFVKLYFVLHMPKGLGMFMILVSAGLAATIAVGLPFFRLFEWPYLREKSEIASLKSRP